jgi:hypothetical protein
MLPISWMLRSGSFGFAGLGFYGNRMSNQADKDAEQFVRNSVDINNALQITHDKPFMINFTHKFSTAFVEIHEQRNRVTQETKEIFRMGSTHLSMPYEKITEYETCILRRIQNPSFGFSNLLPGSLPYVDRLSLNNCTQTLGDQNTIIKNIQESYPKFSMVLSPNKIYRSTIQPFGYGETPVHMAVTRSGNNLIYHAVGHPKTIAAREFANKKATGDVLQCVGTIGFAACWLTSFI